jgi:hypothetical protein
MDTNLGRIILTYQGATFKRTFVCLAIAIISWLVFTFFRFSPEVPPPGTVAGPSLGKLAVGMLIVFSIIFGISEVLFVVGVQFFRKRIECDEDNLYIIRKDDVESTIPFLSIYAVKLSSAGINRSVRGTYTTYLIKYKEPDGRSEDRAIDIYSKNGNNFRLFIQWLQQKNPAVEVKNWSTSLDGLFSLFRKKKNDDPD